LKEEYPEDLYIKLNGEENFLGRITVNKQGKFFSAEIDIVLKESKKIFKHVDILYKYNDKDEVIHWAIQRLSDFLRSLRSLN